MIDEYQVMMASHLILKHDKVITDIEGNVIAHARKIPKIGDQEYIEELIKDKRNKLYRAYDGIVLRIYKYKDAVYASTNNLLDLQGTWGPPGCRTIKELYEDVEDQFDHSKIIPGLTYIAVMEHKDHYGIVGHKENRLILLHVIRNSTGEYIPIEHCIDHGFRNVVEEYHNRKKALDTFVYDGDEDLQPVTSENYGIIVWTPEEELILGKSAFSEYAAILREDPDVRKDIIQLSGRKKLIEDYVTLMPQYSKFLYEK